MLENIRLSFQGVWSHRLRSFLTMLGIIIGIAAIIAIVSTIKGTNEQIKKNLIGSGTNTTTVQLTESGNYPAEMEYGIPKGNEDGQAKFKSARNCLQPITMWLPP